MAVIGPIVITITFCPEGVFIPVHVKKLDFYFGTGAQLRGDYDQGAERKFHYENVQLEYELSQFSPKATEELFNHVKNGEFILDNCSLEFINHFYVLPYPSIDGSSEFKEKREIKAMHLIFMTDLYQHTPFSRKLARHNKGFKRIQLTYKNKNFPEVPAEHNSYNTSGDRNCDHFWNQLAKSIETQHSQTTDPLTKPILTKQNFCLNHSLSETFAILNYADSKAIPFDLEPELRFADSSWQAAYLEQVKRDNFFNALVLDTDNFRALESRDELKGDIVDFQNKSIFTFNFDDMKYSYGLYRNGIKVAPNDKFKLSLHRISDYQKYDPLINFHDIYTYLYILVEYYESLVLNIDGKFESY